MSCDEKFIQLREEISKDLKPILSHAEKACRDFYILSNEENLEKMNSAQNKATDFYDNPEIYKKLKEINDNGGVTELHLKKQLKKLTSEFGDGIEFKKEIKTINEKENEISQKINSYIMEINNEPVSKAEIVQILQTETNTELRKKAYIAKISAGDYIADDLTELVNLRNDFARKKGYDNYFDYKLEEDYDITPNELDKLLQEVCEKTKNANEKVLAKTKENLSIAFNIPITDLRKYHFGLITGENPEKAVNEKIDTKEEVVDICKNTYKCMGYNIDNLPIILDLFPRENKNTHGFSFPIEAGKDARILANLTNNVSSIDTLLHELGHSVFTVKTNPNLPFLEQDTTCTMTEAIAMMMGDLPRLENIMENKISDEIFENFKKSLGDEDSKFIASSLTIIDFERNMYKNPNQDLKQLWKDLCIKYKGHSISDTANNEWATIPHYLSHPAYYQNYFRASLIKAQIYNALTQKLGELTKNSNTANYLDEHIFQYGGAKFDDEILMIVSGKKLSAEDFCNRINDLVRD